MCTSFVEELDQGSQIVLFWIVGQWKIIVIRSHVCVCMLCLHVCACVCVCVCVCVCG